MNFEGWTEERIKALVNSGKVRAIGDRLEVVADAKMGEPRKHKLGRGIRETIDGYSFPSKKEADRYRVLKDMQHRGEVKGLEVHPWWLVQVNGIEIMTVFADFMYYRCNPDCTQVVEDVKGERLDKNGKVKFTTDTKESKVGRRLMLAVYGITIEVIT